MSPARALVPLLLTAAGLAQAPAGLQERAVELLRARATADDLPGLSAAIGAGGAVVWSDGTGFADLENSVPATAATVYRLASISKPVTATCVLRLVEAGKLDLDQDVRTWVPEFPQKPWPVTLRQLLGHLAGIRHYRPDEGERTTRYATQRAGLAVFADDPLLHEPGTEYRYSTFGYNLAAAAVEAAHGKPFAAAVQELVAGPADAPTLQDDDSRRLIPHRAQGYRRNAAGALENSRLMDSSYKLGGGGLCASAPDLARFALALLAGKLVNGATRTAMWTAQTTRAGERTGYGLGFRVGRHDGRHAVWHTGAQARVSTVLYLLPDDGVVVAVLCNLEGSQLVPLARELAALAVPR